MSYVVEVAHLINGDLAGVRQLSERRERRGALVGLAVTVAVCAAAMCGAALAARSLGQSLYAPGFVVLWLVTGVGLSTFVISTVRGRLGRYRLGSRLDADAFAPIDVDLVRRAQDRFTLTVVPGMTGYVDGGRAPLPVEALVEGRPAELTLDLGGRAELTLGPSTFVVRALPGAGRKPEPFSRDLFKLFSRNLGIAVQVALAASVLCAVPRGETILDRAAHMAGMRGTTPWEAEKWLRIEAQSQAPSLYQCFDPLPLACQHQGYVGIGVSLSRDGEVRSNWIARSTFGEECPVDHCMQDVVSSWVFDPLPEAMRVVLPVQVLRTEKPLPTKLAEATPVSTSCGGRGR